jgi:hypothetical protein
MTVLCRELSWNKEAALPDRRLFDQEEEDYCVSFRK